MSRCKSLNPQCLLEKWWFYPLYCFAGTITHSSCQCTDTPRQLTSNSHVSVKQSNSYHHFSTNPASQITTQTMPTCSLLSQIQTGSYLTKQPKFKISLFYGTNLRMWIVRFFHWNLYLT